MREALRRALRRFRHEESGQSLIVMISALTVLTAMAAFGIDAASWMVKHHRAQLVADSAALAAAHCLANPGQASSISINGAKTTIPACTSGTDITDAQTVAEDYAAANGVTISASQVSVDTSTDKVTVRASATSSSIFAAMFGLGTTTQGAGAGASWSSGSAVCTDPSSDTGCDFLFAHNSDCSSSMNGIHLGMAGNSTVNGNIVSNGNLSGGTAGNISLGTATYGPNGTSDCSNTVTYAGHNPWSSPPTQQSQDLPFPVDYTKDFPACGAVGELPCQSNGYPSFCTNEGGSITFTGNANGDVPISGNIYCAVGSGTKSDPSTWNGSITINVSGNYTWNDTFVGGTILYNVSGNEKLSSCGYATAGYTDSSCNSCVPAPVTGNYPIFYATGTGSSALDVNIAGGQTLNGDLFVPNGTALLNMAGNKVLTTFVEANDIEANIAGTFQGDGPIASGSGSSSTGSDALIQ